MSVVYLTSDWHFGHNGIERFRTEFGNCNEMEGLILENYLSTVSKRDIVWMLGDMAFTSESLQLLGSLPGSKRLVLGNHDRDKIAKTPYIPIRELVRYFDEVYGLARYKGAWLSHAPIHPNELRGKFNIHGHVHTNTIDDKRYENVCVDVTDWKPKSYQLILKERKEREDGYK